MGQTGEKDPVRGLLRSVWVTPLLESPCMPQPSCAGHPLAVFALSRSPHGTLHCDQAWRPGPGQRVAVHEHSDDSRRRRPGRSHRGAWRGRGAWGGAKGAVLTETGTKKERAVGRAEGLPMAGAVAYILLAPQRTWPLSPSRWCQIPRRRREESGWK